MKNALVFVTIFASFAWHPSFAQSSIPASEIRSAVVGKTLVSRVVIAQIQIAYSIDGKFTSIAGRDGGTTTVYGTYEIADGKICHKTERAESFCYAVTREKGSYVFTGARGTKRVMEVQ